MLNYLEGANRCYDNGAALLRAAQAVHNYEKDYPIASNLLDTALEELLKGVFCMFVHFDCMTEADIYEVFKDHGVKAKLELSMFDGVEIEGKVVRINGQVTTKFYDRKIDKDLRQNHMDERNFAVYVDRQPTNSKSPTAWQSPADLISHYASKCVKKLDSVHMTAMALKDLIDSASIPSEKISFQLIAEGTALLTHVVTPKGITPNLN